MDKKDCLVEEYKALRDEILKKQESRLIVLGFSITAVGTIMGLTLGSDIAATQGLNYYILALTSFALVIITAALLLTIQYGQQVRIIAAYIREFIEPEMDGWLRWETLWYKYRRALSSNPKANELPLGSSKPLALFYGLLTIAVCATVFVTGLYRYILADVIIMVLALFALACSYDLHQKKTKGWKVNWENVESQHKQQHNEESPLTQ